MEKPTQEELNRWYTHKSNKERWIEAQEVEDEGVNERYSRELMEDNHYSPNPFN